MLKDYYTLLVPYVPAPYATEWHPTEATGQWSVLNRGNFATVGAAIDWARAHLGGAPYEIKLIKAPTVEVTATHVDTCLGCYLTDHHNREGERLVGIYPRGQSVAEAADEVCDEFEALCDEEDAPTREMVRAAALECLANVDLRWINGNGGRWDYDASNTECIDCGRECLTGDARCQRCNDGADEEAQAWILLSFTVSE